MGRLGEHGFNPKMMMLHLMDGNMWLVKEFGDLSVQEVIHDGSILLNTDIIASAKDCENIRINNSCFYRLESIDFTEFLKS
ncbi:MAG: hypothetical protein Q4C54_05835 [Clostridia bacterium]|nr:hypothetical protein [Clostridia bacterium]